MAEVEQRPRQLLVERIRKIEEKPCYAFCGGTIDQAIGWVWNFEGSVKERLGSREIFPYIEKIVALHERNNHWISQNVIGQPPYTKISGMEVSERLEYITSVLQRREDMEFHIYGSFAAKLGNLGFVFRTDNEIPESGALRFNVGAVTEVGELTIGNVDFDVEEGRLRIYEVQTKEPSYQDPDIKSGRVDKERAKKIASSTKRRLRNAVKAGRNERMSESGFQYPGEEEFFITVLHKYLVEEEIIGRDCPVEILNKDNIAYGTHNEYVRDVSIEDSMSRALDILLESEFEGNLSEALAWVESMIPDYSKKRRGLIMESFGDSMANLIWSKVGYSNKLVQEVLADEEGSIERLGVELILSRIEETQRKEVLADYGKRSMKDFFGKALSHTVDAKRIYYPYAASFSDVAGVRDSDIGRAVSAYGIYGLPFAGKIILGEVVKRRVGEDNRFG